MITVIQRALYIIITTTITPNWKKNHGKSLHNMKLNEYRNVIQAAMHFNLEL